MTFSPYWISFGSFWSSRVWQFGFNCKAWHLQISFAACGAWRFWNWWLRHGSNYAHSISAASRLGSFTGCPSATWGKRETWKWLCRSQQNHSMSKKEFGHATTLEDQSQWRDFAFSFKSWFFFAEPAFEVVIQYVEDHPAVPVTYQDNPSGAVSRERPRKLYSILAGILKQRPLKTLRQVGDANGLEVWRQLHGLYMPKTKGRALALLNALMGTPAFTKERTCLEQIQNMEMLSEEHRKASGQEINDDILLSTLIRVLPRHTQQHIQWPMDEQSSFAQVKGKVLAYERVSSTWTKDRVLADTGIAPLGAVSSYANDGGASAPMEINMIKGKGNW